MNTSNLGRYFLLLAVCFGISELSAQQLSWMKSQPQKNVQEFSLKDLSFSPENPQTTLSLGTETSQEHLLGSPSIFSPSLSERVIPAYARSNPSGYSYLCQMELQVEKNLPVPLWFRAGKIQEWEHYNSSAMYVQVKLLGFKK